MTPVATATAEMLPPVDAGLIATAPFAAVPVPVVPAAAARPLAATISQLVRPRIAVMVLATVAGGRSFGRRFSAWIAVPALAGAVGIVLAAGRV